LSILTTFGLVSLGWVFFRASSTPQALGLFSRALMPWQFSYRALSGTFYLHVALLTLAVWMAPIAARWVVAGIQKPRSLGVDYASWLAQGGVVGVMLVLCLIYLRGQSAFIYFQF
jgi:hypothetical protein